MSTAIIRKEEDKDFLVYCKHDSYPAGLGFDLLKLVESLDDIVDKSEFDSELAKFFNNDRFELVKDIPTDIQYEYIIQNDNDVHCQECWYTADAAYHGGGFRHGGVYNLKEWRKKIDLQKQYAYRRLEAWESIERL